MKMILITGTKGKTTLALMLNAALLSLDKKTLCICSEGVIENGITKKDNEYFLKKYETSANVAAIKEISEEKARRFEYVIMEASYGARKNIRNSFLKDKIDLAIFTNTYWDHIDGKKIKDQAELFDRKIGLLKNLKRSGTAIIFTGDQKDNLSWKALSLLEKERPDLSLIAYDRGLRPADEDGPDKYYLKNRSIYRNNVAVFNIDSLEHSFKNFPVFQNNLLALTASLISLKIDPQILLNNAVNLSAPGRLNIFNHKNHTVILDYAHEIKSLSFVAKFIRTKFKGKPIHAVIRFSYYRKAETIKKLTLQISKLFDTFTIYDKALSRPSLEKVFTYNKAAGSVAKLMADTLKAKNMKSEIIDDELVAIKESIRRLKADEILFIMGDQIKKDIRAIETELHKK